jgi:hypothetical protein
MRSSRITLLLSTAALLFFIGWPAWAQTPSLTDPEGILAWLKLQGIGVSFVLTLLWKYVPILKELSNRALPWLVLGGWVVAQTAGVQVVQAATGDAASATSFLHKIGVAIFNSAISKALWDGWLKPTVGGWLDSHLTRRPQTP